MNWWARFILLMFPALEFIKFRLAICPERFIFLVISGRFCSSKGSYVAAFFI